MRIFLSFAYDEDIEQVNGFRGMLDNPNAGIEFEDGSCRKDYGDKSEAEIKRIITSLLDRCSVTVCLLSKKTKGKKWVDWELEASQSKEKGIAGIVLKGKNEEIKTYDDCPNLLDGKRYEVHYWNNPETIQKWIEKAEKNR